MSDLDADAIRRALHEHMTAQGLTQSSFARRSGVSQSIISRLLSTGAASRSALERIAAELGLTPAVAPADADLGWALRNAMKFQGYSDLVPKPFEFRVLDRSEGDELATLARTSSSGAGPTWFLPKPAGGYRSAGEMHPMAFLQYAAAVRSMASAIETYRYAEDSACSYRLAPKEDGALLEPFKLGWKRFAKGSDELSGRSTTEIVLCVDVVDFYAKVPHAAIRRALADAGVDSEDAAFVCDLLGAHARGVPQGLPVGPSPSIILAELVLTDLDHFLGRRGVDFVRYVDDIRIFADSPASAFRLEYEVAEFLDRTLGLRLNESKTRHWTKKEFRGRYHDISGAAEIEVDVNAGQEVDAGWSAMIDAVAGDRFVRALGRAKDGKALALGRVRSSLRRMRSLRYLDAVLEPTSLEVCLPALPSVCSYLARIRHEASETGDDSRVAGSLLDYLEGGARSFVPWVQHWILDTLIHSYAHCHEPRLLRACERAATSLGQRPMALLARERNYRDWVRSQASEWTGLKAWERRAVLYAAEILTPGEREEWADRANETGDPLDRLVGTEVRKGDVVGPPGVSP